MIELNKLKRELRDAHEENRKLRNELGAYKSFCTRLYPVAVKTYMTSNICSKWIVKELSDIYHWYQMPTMNYKE